MLRKTLVCVTMVCTVLTAQEIASGWNRYQTTNSGYVQVQYTRALDNRRYTGPDAAPRGVLIEPRIAILCRNGTLKEWRWIPQVKVSGGVPATKRVVVTAGETRIERLWDVGGDAKSIVGDTETLRRLLHATKVRFEIIGADGNPISEAFDFSGLDTNPLATDCGLTPLPI